MSDRCHCSILVVLVVLVWGFGALLSFGDLYARINPACKQTRLCLAAGIVALVAVSALWPVGAIYYIVERSNAPGAPQIAE